MMRNHGLTRQAHARTLTIALEGVEGAETPHRLLHQFHFDRACRARRVAH